MSAEFSNEVKTTEEQHSSHTALFAALIAGLVVALAGDGFLLMRANHFDDQMSQNTEATQSQIAKLGDATTSLLEQRLQTINDEMSAEVKGAQTSAATALKQARAQAEKQSEELSGKLEEQHQQVTGQIAQLKDATSEADNKIAAVSTDVDGVKTDVNGVKTDVASTKDGLDKTGADLKRAIGDMGVMSGLIATNSKDLNALRELGDRNYVEFTLSKGQMQKKIGDVDLIKIRDRFTATPFIEFFNLFNRNNPGANYVTNVAAFPNPVNNVDNVTSICSDPQCSSMVPVTSAKQLRFAAGALGDFFGPGTTVGIPFAAQVGARFTF